MIVTVVLSLGRTKKHPEEFLSDRGTKKVSLSWIGWKTIYDAHLKTLRTLIVRVGTVMSRPIFADGGGNLGDEA